MEFDDKKAHISNGLEVAIPEIKVLKYLVMDMNGTLTLDGRFNNDGLLAEVQKRLDLLRGSLESLHLVSGDTYGTLEEIAQLLDMKPMKLQDLYQAEQKAAFVRGLGAEHVAAIGNGANDRLMLREAALSIVVVGDEGAALEALLEAKVVTGNILRALDLLLNPLRLKATLRT
jgi:soluble P-type ATPase